MWAADGISDVMFGVCMHGRLDGMDNILFGVGMASTWCDSWCSTQGRSRLLNKQFLCSGSYASKIWSDESSHVVVVVGPFLSTARPPYVCAYKQRKGPLGWFLLPSLAPLPPLLPKAFLPLRSLHVRVLCMLPFSPRIHGLLAGLLASSKPCPRLV